MKNLKDKLKINQFGEMYDDGYRVVYFNNDEYKIGEYCKTIEGFMIGFAECDPIIDEDDIPPFVSIDDLLNRYLNSIDNVSSVAIYNVNGDCIAQKDKNKNNMK